MTSSSDAPQATWPAPAPTPTDDPLISCRATDAAGETQPLEPPWNYQGMGNNGVQTVGVTVRGVP